MKQSWGTCPYWRYIEVYGEYWAPTRAHIQHDLGFTQSKPSILPCIVSSDMLKDVRESGAGLSQLAHKLKRAMSRALEHIPCSRVGSVLLMSQSNECRLGAGHCWLQEAPWTASLLNECCWKSEERSLQGPQPVMYSLAGLDGGTFDKWTPLAELCQGDLGSGVASWLVYLPTTMLASSSVPPPLSSDSYWLIMRPCSHEWMSQATKDTQVQAHIQTHRHPAWLCWDRLCWRASVVSSMELCCWNHCYDVCDGLQWKTGKENRAVFLEK